PAWRKGRCNAPGTASDHANLIWAALRLYQATNQHRFLKDAENLTRSLNEHYWLATEHRYATSAEDTSDVIVRLASGTDDATPNANGIMVSNLAALTLITGNLDYVQQAAQIVDSFGPELAGNLIGYTGLLAAEYDLSRPQIIATFVNEHSNGDELIDAIRKVGLPGALEFTFTGEDKNLPPALSKKAASEGTAAASYICIGPQCSLPITEADNLAETLRDQRRHPETA
ncbi:MAG: thioredoxin domain-containing protein, partial [Pseudomonadota bacterium]